MNRKVFCILAFIIMIFTRAYAEENYINVESYGRGHDRQTAMENALEEALRKNMGTMIMTREELKNETLTEKIIQVSRGSINEAEILSERIINSEYILHVRFRIDSNHNKEAVMNMRKGTGGKFNVKRRPFIENARNVIDSFFRKINILDFINAETEDRKIDIAKGELSITVRLSFNREKYLREFYTPLNDILDELLTSPEIDSELSGEDEKIKYAVSLYVMGKDRTFTAWRMPLLFWEAMKNSAELNDSDSEHVLTTQKRLWLNLMLMDSNGRELSAERIPVNLPVSNILFFSMLNDSDSGVWSLTGSITPEIALICAPFFGETDSGKKFYSSIYSDRRDPFEKRFIFHLPIDTLSRIHSVTSALNPEK